MTKSRGIRTKSLSEYIGRNCQLMDSGCVEWTGSINPKGYGRIRFRKASYGKTAHHAVWALANGAVPAGMMVCHHCDNRRCIRLDHLFLGTALDNNRDMMAKGRANLSGLIPGPKGSARGAQRGP